ncbi:MAG: ribonuclease P protein component [Deltaproteobacteria bacterium]|nr:MAG: ribonuclease P protein component [Deltaproteobacteria bacterium]
MAEPGPPSRDFPKSVRLRRSVEFKQVQRRGKRLSTENLRICVLPNALAAPRFGLTVSRKVGNAVVRNRVKRWLREAIRHERVGAELGAVDLVFIAWPSAADAGAESIRKQVARSFARLGRSK